MLSLPGRLATKLRRVRRARAARCVPIVSAGAVPTLVLDPSRTASVFLPRVHRISRGGRIDLTIDRLAAHLLVDATISTGSDIILTPGGALWDKHARPQFGKAIPLDRDLAEAGYDSVRIDRSVPSYEVDFALSLCGVHATVWSHFLVQYLPKLAALDAIVGMSDRPLTVITPAYDDPHLREIVAQVVARHTNVSVLEIAAQAAVRCATLAHIPHVSYIADHAHYLSIYDMVIPDFAVRAIRQLLVPPLQAPPALAPARKLYLIRRGHRSIVHHARYEALFEANGFELVDPGTFSLSRKIALFREAGQVAGPLSSAFTNLIFCRPGTKALVFTGLQRSTDAYLGMIGACFDIDLLMVAGTDLDGGIHSAFVIPEGTVMAAARDHGLFGAPERRAGDAS